MKEQREIKFKIWDNEKKRMSKPLPVFHPFVEWSDGDIEMPTDFAIVKSKRFIFLQFSGLYDINGKEIYESNIVKCSYGTGKVIFSLGIFWVRWIDDKEANMEMLGLNNKLTNARGYEEMFEIIGNIYETPELIKKETA